MNSSKIAGLLVALIAYSRAACLTSGDETVINTALVNAPVNGIVQLCPSSIFNINNVIKFNKTGQELSTQGYPTGSTRATIITSSSNTNNLTTLINGAGIAGIKIKNVQVDGNRGALGPTVGDANVLVGSTSNGVVVSNVAVRNARGFSCLHVIEGATTYPYSCVNATIINNDIGPCGTEDGGLWADGISFACSSSLVSSNTITGPTDGGIVIFGAPGSTITNNTIIGSATQRGFGAINLVDHGPYTGNYSGVKVTNNKIVGAKMFNIGIAVGGQVWSSQSGPLTGPTVIDGNTISGNVTFPIALNGWQNGITITNTNVAGVSDPHTFSDAFTGAGGDCESQHATWNLFNAAAALSYWSPGITGPKTLDPAFKNSTTGSPANFLCAQPALNNSVTFPTGSYATAPLVISNLHKGFRLQLQGDNNLVAINLTVPDQAAPVLYATGKTANCSNGCALAFQTDGNLVSYVGGNPLWASNTASASGGTNKLIVQNTAPWLKVVDVNGVSLWDTTQLR